MGVLGVVVDVIVFELDDMLPVILLTVVGFSLNEALMVVESSAILDSIMPFICCIADLVSLIVYTLNR